MFPPPFPIPKKGFPRPNARQRALSEWRRIDIREQEGATLPTAKTIADIIPKVVASIRLDRKRSDLEILKVWNNLLDPNITKHAQPANIAKGTLFVNVDTPTWHYEIIRYHRKEILHRLQTAFGPDVIQKISYRIG
jgi:hypothetical protein